ncbi:DUF397 domain-containing protein [Kitasatospora hibisci]|uniref:DUF397 domain-containing protein n=1 Tax=Kitasatospora hibisci TaxID=3369522 RepID=UPI0037548281
MRRGGRRRARAVRDSKDPDGPVLASTPGAWQSFVTAVRAGEFGRSLPTGRTRRSAGPALPAVPGTGRGRCRAR